MDDDLEGLLAEARHRVSEVGYDLVDLRRKGSRGRPLIQVRVDVQTSAAPDRGITHDDCKTVSRALEQWLDESQLFGERYVLEVSSPGIERPVRWPEHWDRFRGRDVNVRIAGRGRLRATIVDVAKDGATVVLRPVGTEEDVTVALKGALNATLAVDW
jgi:ribosome maturation factor RimP